MGLTRRWRAAAAAFVATSALAHAAVAGPFAKGPYLQDLGDAAVTVKVELAADSPVTLEVTGPSGFSKKVDSPPARFHVLYADGLAAATSYAYVVRAAGVASPTGHFTTAPSDGRAFKFVVYGDSRSDPGAHAVIAGVLAKTPADFLVNTGDMVYRGDDPEEWAQFFAIEGDLLRDECVFACVGNHELAGGKRGESAFLKYFAGIDAGKQVERLYDSFRWGNTRFFLLNAMDAWTGAEREWLAAELARADAEAGLVHRIAVLHHGPYSSGPHGPNPRLASGEVVRLMKDHGIDLVLAGHDHIYERGEGGGIKYIISGGAGAPLYEPEPKRPETLTIESSYHVVEVAIEGDVVRTVGRRASGGVIEACSFKVRGPWECGRAGDAPKPAAAPGPAAGAVPRPAAGRCGCDLPGTAPAPWAPLLGAVLLTSLIARRRRG